MHDVVRDDQPSETYKSRLRYPFRFTGKAGEYFGIWIVNLVLTILTLGVYSAWAKVRTNRYFYGNTWLDGHTFDYHASPKQLLLGRMLAIGLIALYVIAPYIISDSYGLMIQGIVALIIFIASPWLIVRSLKFNARMSSYRNVRFDFVGTFKKAALLFWSFPFVLVLTLGIGLPWMQKKIYTFIANNYRFGDRPFDVQLPLGRLYKAFGAAIALFLIPLILLAVVLPFIAGKGTGAVAITSIILVVTSVLLFLYAQTYFQIAVINLLFNNLTLDEKHRFESTLLPNQMAWIKFANILAIMFSFGLLYPWAHIRLVEYRLDNTVALLDGDIEDYSSEIAEREGAIGEEMADVFDVGIVM